VAVRPRAVVPRPLLGSVAVLALGTGVEWLARRFAVQAARAAGRALVGRDGARQPAASPSAAPHDVSVDELIYVREVRLRR
jgi:hypothetical protein